MHKIKKELVESLTENERELVRQAILRTWNAIGPDAEDAYCDGDHAGTTMSNQEALEVCIDGGKLRVYGYYEGDEETKSAVEKFYNLGWPDHFKLAQHLVGNLV